MVEDLSDRQDPSSSDKRSIGLGASVPGVSTVMHSGAPTRQGVAAVEKAAMGSKHSRVLVAPGTRAPAVQRKASLWRLLPCHCDTLPRKGHEEASKSKLSAYLE